MTNEEIIEVFEELIKKYELKEVFLYPRDKFVEAIQTALTILKAQPCEDAISRIAALDALRTNWANWAEYDDGYLAMKLTMDDLKKMPAVPKARTGEWIDAEDYFESSWATCSECKERARQKTENDGWGFSISFLKYCPNCGAKMEGESAE